MKIVTDFDSLDLEKVYSYADYLKWRFEERVELIKGKIFKMSPAPAKKHQEVSGNLFGLFWTHLRNSKCKVYSAPFDVKLPAKSKKDEEIFTVIQPDICIVCDPEKLEERGCTGAPDLIVEILSPTSSKRDLKDKFVLYEESGVAEYWVIYPAEETLEVFRLNNAGKYHLENICVKDDIVKTRSLKLQIDLKEVFHF